MSYFLYLSSFLIGLDFVAYKLRMRKILNPNSYNEALEKKRMLIPPKNVNDETMSALGSVRTDRRSSFVNFDIKKPSGVIRIGCFGDSYTFGDETSEIYDYPTLLQKKIDNMGYKNIQVINFGNSWYGFHQAYLMWSQLGKKYDLDYILLGPKGFFIDRDTTFNHTKDVNVYYIHGRYILKNNEIKWIEPIGDLDIGKRVENYYSFIPRWRYLKYDKNAPMMIKALIPQGKEIKNPFYYYKGDIEKEALTLYRNMIRNMADETPLIMTIYDQGFNYKVYEQVLSLNHPNIKVKAKTRNYGFPYRALQSHNSSFGNELIAQYMFNSLIENEDIHDLFVAKDNKGVSSKVKGYKSLRANNKVFTTIDNFDFEKLEIELDNISSYQNLRFEIGGRVVGVFTGKKDDKVIKNFEKKRLLIIKSRGLGSMDSLYLPLNSDLSDNMSVFAFDEKSGKRVKLQDVYLEVIDEKFGIYKLITDGLYYANPEIFKLGKPKWAKFNNLKKDSRIELLINNKPIAYLIVDNQNNSFNFEPIKDGNVLRIGVVPSGYVDLKIGESRDIYLVMEKENKTIRVLYAQIAATIEN